MTMRKFLAHGSVRRGAGRVMPAFLACLILLPAAPRVCAGSSSLQEEETRKVKVDSETGIYVKNSRGKTIIVGKKGASEVTVRVMKFVRARDQETAEKWMKELGFSVETDGNQISVVTRHPGSAEGGGGVWALFERIRERAYIDYTIEVPSAFDAKVSSTSGAVQITSIEGGVKVFGSSGDVFLKSIGGTAFVELSSGTLDADGIGKDLSVRMSSGDAVVRSVGGSATIQGTSGDATVYDIDGNSSVQLSSGDVTFEGAGGNLTVETHSGDIQVTGVEGAVNAEATTGDVYVTINSVGPKEQVLKSSSGDVDVSFAAPDGYGFILEVDTSSGSIEGNLEIKLDEISRKTLRGVVGSGGGRLMIETASGNIRINQLGR
jgi:hypothetical protein